MLKSALSQKNGTSWEENLALLFNPENLTYFQD
jgi:hypothetical protein